MDIGDCYLAQRSDGTSRLAKLIEIRKQGDSDVDEYYVHYEGCDRRLDEWVSLNKIDLSSRRPADDSLHSCLDGSENGSEDSERRKMTQNQKRKHDEVNSHDSQVRTGAQGSGPPEIRVESPDAELRKREETALWNLCVSMTKIKESSLHSQSLCLQLYELAKTLDEGLKKSATAAEVVKELLALAKDKADRLDDELAAEKRRRLEAEAKEAEYKKDLESAMEFIGILLNTSLRTMTRNCMYKKDLESAMELVRMLLKHQPQDDDEDLHIGRRHLNLFRKCSTSEKDFNKAAENVRNLKGKPSKKKRLELYALFKQATVGDNNTARPGMMDFKGKAKWDAWDAKKGVSKEDAQKQYIQAAQKLIEKFGLN